MRSLPGLLCLLALPLTLTTFAAPATEDLATKLAFEGPHEEDELHGWSGKPPTVTADAEVVHGGKWSARIERDAASEHDFTPIGSSVPVDFAGKSVVLSGFLRLESVEGWAGLWLRQDGEGGMISLDNMQQRRLGGTKEWTEYRIVMPLSPKCRQLVFGALLAGTGKLWVDDLRLLVDGKPVAEAEKVEREETVLDLDREFDAGSGIEITELSARQIENLASLGKVWGFLKYHHPRITKGELHWDYELFRALSAVLAATDRPSAERAMLEWLERLGPAAPCDPCAELPDPQELHFSPGVGWIGELRSELGEYLRQVHRNRHAVGTQHYVSLKMGVGNPDFANEKSYADLEQVDAGYRILALYRFWNIIRYWFPYRDVIGEDWDAVLGELLPRFVAAADEESYTLEMLALSARVHDTHANLWSSLDVRPPQGECRLPVRLRFVEDRLVVAGYLHEEKGPASGLKVGDVVLALDGKTVEAWVDQWSPYYAASNRTTRLRDIARFFTRGICGPARLRGERAEGPFELTPERVAEDDLDLRAGRTHDLPGETFRRLADDVAYLKLSSVKSAEVSEYIRGAAGTRGLIIDIRNYPSEFVVFDLGQRLVAETTKFVRFTVGDLANPGAFSWGRPLELQPTDPRYSGAIVILVDEQTLSQAEYTSMAFRSAPNATVVGSTTAAADGNVSSIPLPGGLRSMISGIGVFYPDKTPTQRVGIVPDVEARPTIDGIRAGRDEVLEEALRQILGETAEEAKIREIATRALKR